MRSNRGVFQQTVSYQTAGSAWRPVYDARLDTGTSSLELEQYGQVAQHTGEDWDDIDLTLSTAHPANGSEMPRLYEWMVGLVHYEVMATDALARAKSSVRAQMAAPAPPSAMQQNMAAEKDEYDALPIEATAMTTEYSAEFHVPGRVTLKSANDPTKLFIASTKMKANLSAQTTPRLIPQAFLFAKVTNEADYPMLPGTVAKYRDGSFIGNAALSLLRPKETADLSFGSDDRIKVQYQRTNNVVDNPTLVVIGDIKVARQYQTKITNLHKDPVAITVFEQYPVSNDSDVTAELNEEITTPGYAKDPEGRQGVIVWAGTLAPKEEKTYDLGFGVKYPKGKQITGL